MIGSRLVGLPAASFMTQAGWAVTVLEKHALPGSHAGSMHAAGFAFDMNPG